MGAIKYLLDTHTFLWAVRGSDKLSKTSLEILENPKAQIFVSAISAYEIMNKHRLGKLAEFDDVVENYDDLLRKLGTEVLPLSNNHAHYAGKLDWIHRDPFDRILASQAHLENLVLITNDQAFNSLSWLKCIW